MESGPPVSPLDDPIALNWTGPSAKVACLFSIAIKRSIIVYPLPINFRGFGLSAWRPFADVPWCTKKCQPARGVRNQVEELGMKRSLHETTVTVKRLGINSPIAAESSLATIVVWSGQTAPIQVNF
jgi:hypothetical protein